VPIAEFRKLREDKERLQNENAELEKEKDALKKKTAFFQQCMENERPEINKEIQRLQRDAKNHECPLYSISGRVVLDIAVILLALVVFWVVWVVEKSRVAD
jgi:chromosome segregation ATPase